MEPRYDNFRIPPRPHGSPQPRPQAPPRHPHHAPPAHPVVTQPAPQPIPASPPAPVQHPTAAVQHSVVHPAPTAHQVHHQPALQTVAAPRTKKKRGGVKKFFKTAGIIVLVAILAAGVFAAYKYGYKPYLDRKNTASAAPMTEATSSDPAIQLADTIGKTIDLPSETPLLVTVQDASKVSANPFFAKTQSGDQVLYYQSAKIAVLYRPSTKKVINYSPNAVISNLQDASTQSQ